jgi:hypothetical protein
LYRVAEVEGKAAMFAALPASPHYTVEELGISLKFIFPYRKEWLTIIGSTVSLLLFGVWLSIVIAVFAQQPVSPLETIGSVELVPCLAGLAFLTIPVMYVIELLWLLIGKEVIEISDDGIIVRHQILGLGIARKFRANKVNSLFVSRVKTDQLARWLFRSNRPGYFNFKQGKVAFNCGRTIWGGVKTFRFGTILDEEEAGQVVSVIHKRFPQYLPQKQRANANT